MKKIVNDFGPINFGMLIVTVFSLIVSAGLLWWSMENESYIRTVDQSLANKMAEIQQLEVEKTNLESDLSDEKQRSLELADELNQINMRNEGIMYQEWYEGLDKE